MGRPLKRGTVMPYLEKIENFESLKDVLINMVKVLVMSAKMAALGLYKIKLF